MVYGRNAERDFWTVIVTTATDVGQIKIEGHVVRKFSDTDALLRGAADAIMYSMGMSTEEPPGYRAWAQAITVNAIGQKVPIHRQPISKVAPLRKGGYE